MSVSDQSTCETLQHLKFKVRCTVTLCILVRGKNATSNRKARSGLAVTQQAIISVLQSRKTESITAPLYIGACTTAVDPCTLHGMQCILFHNYPFLQRNRHGVFDHPVMILEVHQGLAASSLSSALLQGYSQDVLTKSDAWCFLLLAVISVSVTHTHTHTKKKRQPRHIWRRDVGRAPYRDLREGGVGVEAGS